MGKPSSTVSIGMWERPACAGCCVGAVHITKINFGQRAPGQLGGLPAAMIGIIIQHLLSQAVTWAALPVPAVYCPHRCRQPSRCRYARRRLLPLLQY